MRDQDRRSARCCLVQGFHDAALSDGVEGGGGFVENLEIIIARLQFA